MRPGGADRGGEGLRFRGVPQPCFGPCGRGVRSAGDYKRDHSPIIYVGDPQRRFTASFLKRTTPDRMVAKLRQLGA